MRVFLMSVLAAFIIAGGGLVGLSSLQRASGAAYSTDGVRINPNWSWRRMLPASMNQARVGQKGNNVAGLHPNAISAENDEAMAAGETCEQTSALRWMFIDLTNSADDFGLWLVNIPDGLLSFCDERWLAPEMARTARSARRPG